MNQETKIQKIYRLVYEYFQDQSKVNAWMQTKNPSLGNQTPMQMMKQLREDRLLKFIENSIAGNNP